MHTTQLHQTKQQSIELCLPTCASHRPHWSGLGKAFLWKAFSMLIHKAMHMKDYFFQTLKMSAPKISITQIIPAERCSLSGGQPTSLKAISLPLFLCFEPSWLILRPKLHTQSPLMHAVCLYVSPDRVWNEERKRGKGNRECSSLHYLDTQLGYSILTVWQLGSGLL